MDPIDMDVILLAGGFGTRLRSVVSDRPKPMAPVLGRPFVEWLIRQVRAQGMRRIILSTGHMAWAYRDYFGDGGRLNVELLYSHEQSALGTGGALRLATDRVQTENVLVLNADSYVRFDARKMLQLHEQHQAIATLCCVSVPDSARYGTVSADSAGRILSFNEKHGRSEAGVINAGVYVIRRDTLMDLAESTPISLERALLPAWLPKGVYCLPTDGPFLDIGTPDSYAMADTFLKAEFANLTTTMTNEAMKARALAHFAESQRVLAATASTQLQSLIDAAHILQAAFRAGNKLLICGNGGSAADAQHLATEFVSRLTKDFARPALPAIALTTDTSFLTAYANDIDFDGVFDRQVEALGKPGDVLLGFSTSGSSRNVTRAVERAQRAGMRSLVIVGEGGTLPALAECAIVVPSRSTQHVQESTIALYHVLCDLTEQALFA